MRLSLCSAMLFFWANVASAAAPPPARTDHYGDALPDGAIARLGSVRLRHVGLCDSVCLPDNKTVLTCGRDRTLRYWDLKSGKQVRATKLQGKGEPGYSVLSPDGKTLVTIEPGRLVFYEVSSGKVLTSVPAPKESVSYLYFSPDGNTLAVGRGLTHVSLWDWKASKERVLELPIPNQKPGQLMQDSTTHGGFSPDGKWFVAAANLNQPITVYDAKTGREVYQFLCGPLRSVVSPDSKTLVAACWRNDKGAEEAVLRYFDLTTGKPGKQLRVGFAPPWNIMAFSPDGKTLFGSANNRTCVIDADTGRVLHRIPGSAAWVSSVTPNGKTVIGIGHGRLLAWDMTTNKLLHEFPNSLWHRLATASSPDGKHLAVGCWGELKVDIWDMTTGQRVRQIPLPRGSENTIRNLAITPDGRTLIAHIGGCGLVHFLDFATGKEQRTLQLVNKPMDPYKDHLYFYQMHLSADRKRLSGLQQQFGTREQGDTTRLGVWDADTGKLLHEHSLPAESRNAIWRDDGKLVTLLLRDGLTLWDMDDEVTRFRVTDTSPGPLVASADFRLLAARRLNGNTVGVWESLTGKQVATLATGEVSHMAFMPDPRFLVTTDAAFLRVWDLATGKERLRWALPTEATDSDRTLVTHLHLSPDGRRAFTGLGDGTGLVWNLTPALSAPPLAKAPDKKALEAWWADLSNDDAARAYAAVWRLSEQPEATVLGLLKRLRAPADADAATMRKFIEALGSDDFETREKATKQLEALGRSALPGLKRALEKQQELEVRRRLEKLVASAKVAPLSPDELRWRRGVEVLERLGTREARRLLDELMRQATPR